MVELKTKKQEQPEMILLMPKDVLKYYRFIFCVGFSMFVNWYNGIDFIFFRLAITYENLDLLDNFIELFIHIYQRDNP